MHPVADGLFEPFRIYLAIAHFCISLFRDFPGLFRTFPNFSGSGRATNPSGRQCIKYLYRNMLILTLHTRERARAHLAGEAINHANHILVFRQSHELGFLLLG